MARLVRLERLGVLVMRLPGLADLALEHRGVQRISRALECGGV